MGAGLSRQEDALWRAVKAGDENAVLALHSAGASLESLDRSGKTPLISACNQPLDMSDMVRLLLSLGANPNVSGFWSSPLHLAAERGHKDTVSLLLDHGANPWAVNHDGFTPLDMARDKGHATVVRVIEGKLCLFSGTVRETKGGTGILHSLLQGVLSMTEKVWAVVLPSEAHLPGRPPKLDLVIYYHPPTTSWDQGAAALCDVAVPGTVLHLADCALDLQPPVLIMTHRATGVRYMFLDEVEGNCHQIRALWRACMGLPQPGSGAAADASSSSSTAGPTEAGKAKGPGTQVPSSGQGAAKGLAQASRRPDWVNLLVQVAVVFAKALWQALDTVHIKVDISEEPSGGGTNVKVRVNDATPTAKGINVTYNPGTPRAPQPQHSNGSMAGCTGTSTSASGRGPSETSRRPDPSSSSSTKAESRHGQNAGTSFASQATASSTPRGSGAARVPDSVSTRAGSSTGDVAGSARPSAPPLPAEFGTTEGPVLYPAVDTSQVHVVADEPSAGHKDGSAKPAGAGAGDEEGRCVICWDAPAQAACVPCGHFVGCMDCLSGIKGKGLGCPVCRAPIQHVLKVYKG